MDQPSSKQFKKLQKQWYNRLKESGFEDIENSYGRLSGNTVNRWYYDPTKVEAKTTYYRYASHFLNEHKFESKVHKYIWTLHAEGCGLREISAKLKALRISKLKKSQIHNIVTELAKLMLEKYKNDEE